MIVDVGPLHFALDEQPGRCRVAGSSRCSRQVLAALRAAPVGALALGVRTRVRNSGRGGRASAFSVPSRCPRRCASSAGVGLGGGAVQREAGSGSPWAGGPADPAHDRSSTGSDQQVGADGGRRDHREGLLPRDLVPRPHGWHGGCETDALRASRSRSPVLAATAALSRGPSSRFAGPIAGARRSRRSG